MAAEGAVYVSTAVVEMRQSGEEPIEEMTHGLHEAEEKMFGPLRAALGLDQCQVFISGAAPINVDILKFFHAVNMPIAEVYGQTEGTGPTSLNPPRADQDRNRRPADPGRRGPDRRGRRGARQGRERVPRLLPQRGRHRGDARRRVDAHRRRRRARRRRVPEDHRPEEGPDHHVQRQERRAAGARERAEVPPADQPGRRGRRPPSVPGRADHARPGGAGEVRGGTGPRLDRPGRALAGTPRWRSPSRPPSSR